MVVCDEGELQVYQERELSHWCVFLSVYSHVSVWVGIGVRLFLQESHSYYHCRMDISSANEGNEKIRLKERLEESLDSNVQALVW